MSAFTHTCYLDLETRARVNLKTHGAYRYRDCPDQRVLVAGYALDDGPAKGVILPPSGELPLELRNMLADPKVQVRAHNAAFDRLQLKDQAPPIDRWYCTAAQARGVALPGKLEDLGRAIGADIRKDPRGAQLIQLLSIPQADGSFVDDVKLMREFADYCARDIATMRACSLAMPGLRDEDLAVYHASERINDRGLPINTELCRLATQYAAAEAAEAAAMVVELSRGALRTVKGTKLRDWVYARLDPTLRKHMELYKGGKKTTSLATDIRATLLELAAENPDAVEPDVVAMIEAAEAGAMSSTAKFQTMLNRVSGDGRLRGAFVFNGAYQTNRFSSTGAQVHNYPRLVAKDPEAVLESMRRGEPMARPLLTLKSMLRPAIAPKSGRIVRADWNAIEARGLPWLVNTDEARAYMAAFTDSSRDIYVEQSHAAGLGGARQPGKVCFGPSTQVLTDRGVKAMVDVLPGDRLWDGVEWVTHAGLQHNGLQPTIDMLGVTVTPGHQVLAGAHWVAAQTVASSPSIRRSALATGLANLPWSASSASASGPARRTWFACGALAALRRIWSWTTTCAKAAAPGATSAPKKPRGSGVRVTTATPTSSPTTRTVDGFSIACPRASIGAKTLARRSFPTTAGAAYAFTGGATSARSWPMWWACAGGMILSLSWTELTTRKATRRATYDSPTAPPTSATAEPSPLSSSACTTLRRVYDIANAGPRHRFTILTDAGPLIVHNCVLSLGYGGGEGALVKMAKNYGVRIEEGAAVVARWRRANSWVADKHTGWWGSLQRCALRAMKAPGRSFRAGRVTLQTSGENLTMSLPSGRTMHYPMARMVEGDYGPEIEYLKASWKPRADAKEWPRGRLWHGVLAENATQAVCADLLREALLRAERYGLEITGHVHDEMITEAPEGDAQATGEALQRCMLDAPGWATGLPLKAEVDIAPYFRK